MSDVFDDTLAAAAGNFFLLPGCETVTYYPVSGTARKISAVITRSEPGKMPAINALVMNSQTGGISSELVDTGGDKIECAKRAGSPPKLLRITEIINQDAGLMLLAAS